MKLDRLYVEKPWGRTSLPPMFGPPPAKRIGEVWFTGGGDDIPLLVKYLFTSERLSIQVHPNDEQARARGLARGKSECWYILDAEPGATLGLGLKHDCSPEQLRSAALDGSIEQMIEWRPVRRHDFFLVPPGTIHAIGGGISLLEFQQNSDVTYRLYDYGRPRELHLDDAVTVALRTPYPPELMQHLDDCTPITLADTQQFTLVHTREDVMRDRARWAIPLDGAVRTRDEVAIAGECLLLAPGEPLQPGDARMLIGAKA